MLTTKKSVKPVDVVEVSFVVPQDQVNLLRQLVFKYILDNNENETAMKLLSSTTTKLREDIKVWK